VAAWLAAPTSFCPMNIEAKKKKKYYLYEYHLIVMQTLRRWPYYPKADDEMSGG
jgi:hypothetical protein